MTAPRRVLNRPEGYQSGIARIRRIRQQVAELRYLAGRIDEIGANGVCRDVGITGDGVRAAAAELNALADKAFESKGAGR